ncbi:MAG TPA: sugar transferase [Myxococcales bacterium]|jgi:exopolysaccharide biosynthesis polyprenyl glycosylphosphotransferase
MLLRAQRRLSPLLVAADLAIVVGSLHLAQVLRQRLELGMALDQGMAWIWLTRSSYLSAAVAWGLAFFIVGTHLPRRVLELDSWRYLVLASWLGVLFFVAALFFQKVYDFSRLLVGYFFVLVQAALVVRHVATQVMLRRLTRPFARRILVVGGGEVGEEVARRLSTAPFGVTLAGVLSTDDKLDGFERLGSIKHISQVVKEHAIDDVFLALPAEQHAILEDVILRLQADPVRVHFVPDVLELTLVRAKVEDLGGIPVIGLREPPLDEAGRLAKRTFDLLFGSALTLLAAPLMLACAAAIKLSDGGPVFFRQKRVGENGAPFDMLKFRSMVVGAEEKLVELGIDPNHLPADNPMFKLPFDPRVTPVGRFLRRWSLDEVPQFLNVLRGEMSLVGPRPEEAKVVAQYSFFHRKRLAVKPGITGPMQVSGRGDLPLKERLKLELAYIESWTLWADLKILAKTLPVVLWGKGAY